MKTLVLGLGNPILTDDGVGIHVVRAAAARWQREDVAFVEASVGGLRLLDCLAGYERVIMVDAIQTGDGVDGADEGDEYIPYIPCIRKPGDVYRLHPSDLRASLHAGSTHDLSLPGALALGRRLGIQLPDDEAIVIIAVEVEDVLTFGEACTPAVAAAIPHVVEVLLAELAAGEGA